MTENTPSVSEQNSRIKFLVNEKKDIDDSSWSIILNKIIAYLNKTKQTEPTIGWVNLAIIIQEYAEQLINSKLGINGAIEAYNKKKIADLRKEKEEETENDDLNPIELASNGEVVLLELFTKKHLSDETDMLDHCVGKGDNYLKKIIKGTARIWSLRDKNGKSLLTIEYDVRSKSVKQMKKEKGYSIAGLPIDGEEAWFVDFLEILKKIKNIDPPIVIDNFFDTGAIELKDNICITIDGEKKDIAKIIEEKTESVFAGSIILNNEMSDEEIRKISSIKGLKINSSALSIEKKSIITHVAGSISDNSDISLENLESVEGDVDFSKAKFRFIRKLKKIGGEVDFSNSEIIELTSLEKIDGYANFRYSKIKSLGKLKRIEGQATFEDSSIEDLSDLEFVKEHCTFQNTKIKSLGKLMIVGGDLNLCGVKLEDLGQLKIINGNAIFDDAIIERMENLEIINGHAHFDHSKINSLGKLKRINGSAYFKGAEIADLGDLEQIGGDDQGKYSFTRVDFSNSKIKSLGKLRIINGDAVFVGSEIESLGSLEVISKDALFNSSSLKSLGKLRRIGGRASFENTQIKSLENMEEVRNITLKNSEVEDLGNLASVGYIDLSNSKVKSLKNLEHIRGDAEFNDSILSDLGKLKFIGGKADFSNSLVSSLGNLKHIRGSANFINSQITEWNNVQIDGEVFAGNLLKISNMFRKLFNK